jgi:iron complex outermembrane recepter protein
VQSLTSEELASRKGLDLSDTLFRRLASVNVTRSQSNPWQNDVTYRGFLASPLTGSAIGLSVYLDGDAVFSCRRWRSLPARSRPVRRLTEG